MRNLQTTYQLFLVLLFSPFWGMAQMEILDATTSPLNPENLIENVFLGEGVTVLDVTYEGSSAAVGLFKNADPILGLDRGIVMTTGRAASNPAAMAFGADGNGGNVAAVDNNSTASDIDITNLTAPQQPNDVAKFTITFIPTSDTLRFRYIWGSEEYPEFTCSEFNDIFGFFISGPGINGTFENNGENIALIPGTNLPVTINNLNGGSVGANGTPENCSPPEGSLAYSQFYQNNNFTSNQPVYDGYTTVLTAETVVIPCQTYTIKLIVADVSDGDLDSGVFLEAKSFGTGALDVKATTQSLDETLAEGCAGGSIRFELPNAPTTDFPIDYNILGTATNGVDFEMVDTDIIIPAGDTAVMVDIIPIADGLMEPLESIIFDVEINPCKRDTFTIFIRDNDLEGPGLFPDTTSCPSDTIILDGTSPTFIPLPQSFTNDMDLPIQPDFFTVMSEIQVTGVSPRTLGPGVIRSICANVEHRWLDDLDIFLVSPGGQFIELTTDNGANGDNYTNTCFTPTATTLISSPGPVAPASSAPFTGDWLPEGPWPDLWGGPTNGTWQLLLTDDAMGFDGTLLDWTITFEATYDIFYNWQPDQDISCTDCPIVSVYPSDTTKYLLTVSDTYGCELLDSTSVNAPDTLAAPIIDCGTITENSITFIWDAIPGSQGYEVNIEGGGWISPNSGDLAHLVSGLDLKDTIEIEVRGIGECGVRSSILTCQTPECAVPSLALNNVIDVSCFNGSDASIQVTASGGNGTFTYMLNGDTNNNGFFSNLSAGPYQVIVTDGLNCSQTLDIDISQPAPINLVPLTLQEISCNGLAEASATLTISGGTGPYSFNWDGIQNDSIAINLAAGPHFVTITDANGCMENSSINITEPPLLTLSGDSTQVSCFGNMDGTATVTPSGGTGPYLYQWDIAAASQTLATAANLGVGTYTVTVTDDNSCTQEINVSITEPDILALMTNGSDPNCNDGTDGSATANVTGGTPTYTYRWDDPANSTTSMLANLAAGTYRLTATDGNGCIIIDSVVLDNPDAIVVSSTPSAVTCAGGDNGSITTSIMGLVGTPIYQWSNGANTADINTLSAGEYCLTVQDANGCEVIHCATVAEPAAILLTPTITSAGCNGQNNGAIDLSISGGIDPYTINWSTGANTSNIQSLTAGDYFVSVTDANNCVSTLMLTVTESAPFNLDLMVDDITCFEAADGIIDLAITGTTDSLSFNWTGPNGFQSDEQNLDSLVAGEYQVEVVDEEGCSVFGSGIITEPQVFLANYEVENVRCYAEENGHIWVQLESGLPPYRYSIDGGANFQEENLFNGLMAGSYEVIVRDANGCEISDSLEVNEPAELLIELESPIEIKLGQAHEYQAFVNLLQGAIDSIEWAPATTLSCNNCLDPTATPEYTTTYTLMIRDTMGCEVDARSLLVVDRTPSVYVPTAFSPNGDGINDILTIYSDENVITEIQHFQIFDRWGELVYAAYNRQPNDITTGWDGNFKGKPLNTGVFTWIARIQLAGGELEIYTGDFAIIK